MTLNDEAERHLAERLEEIWQKHQERVLTTVDDTARQVSETRDGSVSAAEEAAGNLHDLVGITGSLQKRELCAALVDVQQAFRAARSLPTGAAKHSAMEDVLTSLQHVHRRARGDEVAEQSR